MKVMDKVLICLAVYLLAFTITMTIIFCIKGSVPDELIRGVFGFVGAGEAGCITVIKVAKVLTNEKSKKADIPGEEDC